MFRSPATPDLLPDDERIRTRVLVNGTSGDPGGYVLYWMRVAVRDHDNPALDVAVTVANALGVPAFVYHAVSERYPYASDRHHTFILEGARDVARGLRARGIGYASTSSAKAPWAATGPWPRVRPSS
ncbi:MAG: deoxyribodipyrimidine photo-lyase [Polyangiaceae bacterium]